MRGTEALEGVGVPELMEGAGPEAGPGDKDPQAAWGLDAADGEKMQVPPSVSSVPRIHSSWDLSVGVGGGEDRTLLGLRGACRRRCRGAHRGVASPHARL